MRATIQKYQGYFPITFFVLGFAFDLLTTDRIDQTFSLWQQLVYLLLLMVFLYWEVTRPKIFIEGPKFFQWIWKYHVEAMHFCFGSLLSLYTIFYFKSASFWTSFVFLGFLVSILILNELPRFQRMGLTLRFSMLALCLTSYFVYLVPVVSGEIGVIPFAVATILSTSLFFYLVLRIDRKVKDPNIIINGALIPGVIVNLVFCLLYFFKLLPPVPLSLKYIGIYHQVEKQGGDYVLSYEKADWWRYWEKGAQTFLAEPGDAIHTFVQIFSPTDFSDQVQLVWLKKAENKNGGSEWKTWDTIPMTIRGGRSDGYRGSANKSKYDPGHWMVKVVTSDERELGRLYFDVLSRPQDRAPRQFHQDVH